MSEITLRNPSLETVQAEIDRLAAAANKGQRVRTAELGVSPEQWAESENVRWAGGEGVANKYRGMATCTIVSVAWVEIDRQRIVRIQGIRTTAPKSSYGKKSRGAFDMTELQVEKASAESLAFGHLYRDHAAARTFLGLDAGTPAGIAADRAEEQGFVVLAESLRIAAAREQAGALRGAK